MKKKSNYLIHVGILLIFISQSSEIALAQVSSLSRGGTTRDSGWIALPVARTPSDSDSLFGASGFEAISSGGISIIDGSSAFYSEFLVDNLAVFARLGYGRVGFGTLIQSKKVGVSAQDEENGIEAIEIETAAERFISAGGNAIIYYALPIFAYGASINNEVETIKSQIILMPRIGFDLPALSAGTATASGNLDLGITMNIQAISVRRIFNLFGTIRAGWVPLASDDFYENLDLDSSFSYATLEGGVVLAEIFRISVRNAIAGPKSITSNSPAILSVQIVSLRR